MINIDTPFWEHYFPGKRKFHKGRKPPSCQLASAKAWKKGMFLVKAPVHEMAVFLQSLVNVLFVEDIPNIWVMFNEDIYQSPFWQKEVSWLSRCAWSRRQKVDALLWCPHDSVIAEWSSENRWSLDPILTARRREIDKVSLDWIRLD